MAKVILTEKLGSLFTGVYGDYCKAKDVIKGGRPNYTGLVSYLAEEHDLGTPDFNLSRFFTPLLDGIQVKVNSDEVIRWFESFVSRFDPSVQGAYEGKYILKPEQAIGLISLPSANELPAMVINYSEIEKIYTQLNDSNIFIYSGDGFLESEKQGHDLFDQMCEITRGDKTNNLHYIFPRASSSQLDWEKLSELYRKELGGTVAAVHAYYLRSAINNNFLKYLRVVLIAPFSSQDTPLAFFYLRLFSKQEARNLALDDRSLWLKTSVMQAKNILAQILESIEPLNINQGFGVPFPSETLRWDYRRSFFDGGEYDEKYQAVMDACIPSISLEEVVEQMCLVIESQNEKRNTGRSEKNECSIITLLDVGSGDGRFSKTLCDRLTSSRFNLKSNMTAVEPDKFDQPTVDCCLVDTKRTAFEEFETDSKFDAILFVHSLYAIDLNELIKAYDMLSETGVMFIVCSPIEDNFVNKITQAVDNYCYQGARKVVASMKGREIYRNYGERVLGALGCFFGQTLIDNLEIGSMAENIFKEGESPIGMTINRGCVPRDLVLSDECFSEVGIKAAEFFSHGQVKSRNVEAMSAIFDVFKEDVKYETGNSLKADNWIITLNKYYLNEILVSHILEGKGGKFVEGDSD